MKRLILLSLIFALLLAGCSGPQFLYNRADWFINWYLNDYIDFNRDQQRVFDRVLDDHLQWHRRHELPRIEAEVLAVRDMLGGKLTGEQIHEVSERSIELWRDSVRPALPETAALLRTLSDRQIEECRQALSEANEKFAAEYIEIPESKLREKRAERVRELAEYWLGDLTEHQLQRIEQWSRTAPDVYPAMHRQRQRWQESLAEALAQRSSPAFESRLKQLVLYPRSFWTDAYSELMRANRAAMKELMLDIHASLTDRQREHLFTEIDALLEDIRRLQPDT